MGEDFKTGALAGGANEAMVSYLADRVMPEGYEPGKGGAEQAKANLLAMSNVVGLLSSVVTGGDPQVAADIAATATQYNHLSHSDLTRAAKELNACAAKDGGCSEDVLQKFVRLSRDQEIAAFQSCAANPDSCATTSSMVANAQARAEQLKDLAATAVAPNAQHVFALLLAENNEVQNALAQVTAGAKVDSVVQELQNRLGFSDARKEMIRDAMVAAASMAVGGKAGRGSAGGAKEAGGALELAFDKATRTWTTPAGLDYGQGSAQGNRVLHVLEHARPNPAKTTHSVFSMDRKEILGAVDEAWLKKGSPVVGDPGAYVVPMGRVIGTSGETSIKIIVRPGTSKVITAYPIK